MIHAAQFSGGKDSTALLLYLKEKGVEFEAVFADTGWEHPATYAYIEEVNRQVLDGKLIYLRNTQYDGFRGLALNKGIFPRKVKRYCTEELKLKPIWDWVLQQEDVVTTYTGERKEESFQRATRLSTCPEPQWVEEAGGYWISRPLRDWTWQEVFDIAKRHGVKENPLYRMGAGRVGCWPCAFIGKRELKALLKYTPEIADRIRELEAQMKVVQDARHAIGEIPFAREFFFPSGYIPDRFCSILVKTKDGRTRTVPTCDDVFKYLEGADEDQLSMFDAPKCMSIYNLCE